MGPTFTDVIIALSYLVLPQQPRRQRHPLDVIRTLLRNRSVLLPLSLPGLASAAVATGLLLVFTAEIWDVGLNISNLTATLYAIISIAAASLYLVQVLSLFLPRKDKHIVTEHLAVANTVIFLSILHFSWTAHNSR